MLKIQHLKLRGTSKSNEFVCACKNNCARSHSLKLCFFCRYKIATAPYNVYNNIINYIAKCLTLIRNLLL